jgi:ribose-phosphate pyrophosphokinase
MNTINLIDPSASDILYQAMLFPDGQPHIKLDMNSVEKLNRKEPLHLLSRIASATDLLQVLFLKNSLDYLEFEHIELSISYLLAARMDRVMTTGEPFSLKVLSQMLNVANFKKIRIFDPHSEVSVALIDRSYPITNHVFVRDVLADYFSTNERSAYCLVSPDAGALKKIHQLAQFLEVHDVVECMKERDVKTGALTNFNTTADNLRGKTCFIIDDICDGGGTFIGTAQLLQSKGAAKVVLVVSHGIFSKGTNLDGIDAIYCTNSYRDVAGVHCRSILNYL